MESLAQVLHQVICIQLDRQQQTIQGWTELHIRTPPTGSPFVRLHCLNLLVDAVEVNGEAATFDLRPPPTLLDGPPSGGAQEGTQDTSQLLYQELKESGLTCPDPRGLPQSQLYYHYHEAVRQELQPELTVHLPPALAAAHTPVPPSAPPSQPPASTPQPANPTDPAAATTTTPVPPARPTPSAATTPLPAATPSTPAAPPIPVPETLTVRITYRKPVPDSATLHHPPFLATDPSLRRTRSWVPCADTPTSCCTFELHLTTPHPTDWVAASGRLVKQTLLPPDPPAAPLGARTFTYKVTFPVPPSQLLLAVGPFEVVPDVPQGPPPSQANSDASGSRGGAAAVATVDPGVVITHFCRPEDAAAVRWTARHFHLAAALLANYLSCRCPCPLLQVVWLPPGMLSVPFLWGAGCLLMRGELLVTERQVEAQVEAAAAAARGVARQWFGVLMVPGGGHANSWLLDGLVGHLEGVYLRGLVGHNEVAWRRSKERDAVVAGDVGEVPPLAPEVDQYATTGSLLHGRLYGTEVLERCPVREYKATAVVGMVERKCGEEVLKKWLLLSVGAALRDQDQAMFAAHMGSTFTAPASTRAMTAKGFMTAMWRGIGETGSSRERDAFVLRWIQGRGCPRITAAQKYDRKRTLLFVALLQSGGAACRRAFLKAAQLVPGHELRIVVHEAGGQAPSENAATLTPDDTYKLIELKVNPKALQKRTIKKKGPEGGPEELMEEATGRSPILWMAVDPGGEWLAHTRVLQSERCAVLMLTTSRDAAAQSAAIEGLVASGSVTDLGRHALAAVVVDSKAFCRVRCEAALALARLAPPHGESPELEALLKAAEEPRLGLADASGGGTGPNQWGDLSDHLVAQSLAIALSQVRDRQGCTPTRALAVIVAALLLNDNGVCPWDDSQWLAALLQALAACRPRTPQLLQEMLAQIDRYLARDEAVPSFQRQVGAACLRALTALALALRSSPLLSIARVRSLLASYVTPDAAPGMRRAAQQCMLQLEAASGAAAGPEGVLRAALALRELEPLPAYRVAVLEDALCAVTSMQAEVAATAASGASSRLRSQTKAPPSWRVAGEVVAGLVAVQGQWGDPRSRQVAFMILQRVLGLPPSLFREVVEDEEDGGEGHEISISRGTRTRGGAPRSHGTALLPPEPSRGGRARSQGAAPSRGAAPEPSHRSGGWPAGGPAASAGGGVSAGGGGGAVSGGWGGGEPSGISKRMSVKLRLPGTKSAAATSVDRSGLEGGPQPTATIQGGAAGAGGEADGEEVVQVQRGGQDPGGPAESKPEPLAALPSAPSVSMPAGLPPSVPAEPSAATTAAPHSPPKDTHKAKGFRVKFSAAAAKPSTSAASQAVASAATAAAATAAAAASIALAAAQKPPTPPPPAPSTTAAPSQPSERSAGVPMLRLKLGASASASAPSDSTTTAQTESTAAAAGTKRKHPEPAPEAPPTTTTAATAPSRASPTPSTSQQPEPPHPAPAPAAAPAAAAAAAPAAPAARLKLTIKRPTASTSLGPSPASSVQPSPSGAAPSAAASTPGAPPAPSPGGSIAAPPAAGGLQAAAAPLVDPQQEGGREEGRKEKKHKKEKKDKKDKKEKKDKKDKRDKS